MVGVVFAARTSMLILHPGAGIHIHDADLINVSWAFGQAIHDPLHGCFIHAHGFVVRITGYSRQTRPIAFPRPQDAVLGMRSYWIGWPVLNDRVPGHECGPGAQRIRDLLCVRHFG